MLVPDPHRSLNGPECRGGEKQLQTKQGRQYVEKVGS